VENPLCSACLHIWQVAVNECCKQQHALAD